MRTLIAVGLMLVLAGCASSGGAPTSREASPSEQLRTQLRKHYELGEVLYRNGKMDEAQAEFEAILALKPAEPNANYRLGTIAFKRRDFDRSAEYFQAVVNEDPKHLKAHYNLASIRLMQAENHFKYYAALVDQETDLTKVSELIADIDKFTNTKGKQPQQLSLDKLATTIKK